MTPKKFKELQMLMAEGNTEQISAGYYSRQEIAKMLNRTVVTADRFIFKCLETGSMKRVLVRRPTNSGVRPVPYFSFPTAIVGSAKLNRRLRNKR